MPTKTCPGGDHKPIAQTLFLGASVASFTSNFGWGTQPSQLTVNLVEDELVYSCDPSPSPIIGVPNNGDMYQQFFDPIAGDSDNHFTDCTGVTCFVDKYTGQVAGDNTPLENRVLRGKVYYQLSETLGLVSKYWTKPDPGFFGRRTRISELGAIIDDPENNHPNFKFDIIDTPVYFKMGDFQFGGFVQSWSRDIGSGGKNYTVIVNGVQSILNSCHIIVDKYAGSIFSKASNSIFGSPKNYLGSAGANYTDTDLTHGTIPNVFNIYGFLESFGKGNFGVVRPNENGLSINEVLESLMVLTSIPGDSAFKLDTELSNRADHAIKRAFSPFGRIISRCMQREDNNNLYAPITSAFKKFGVIYPQPLNSGYGMSKFSTFDKCQFVLDLHDVLYTGSSRLFKRLPDDARILGPSITITDLLNEIGDRAGCDFSIEMVPTIHNSKLYHVIKVKTISRLKQPSTNIIENTIKTLECNNYFVTSNTVGKEKNDTPSRSLLVGGQQQRLYQVQSYRLAYTQNNFIYNPRLKRFINYYSLADDIAANSNAVGPSPRETQYGHGKIRFPNFNSSRNVNLSNYIGTSNAIEADYVNIIQDENKIATINNAGFEIVDSNWNSTPELKSGVPVKYGNYLPSTKQTHAAPDATSGGRWFPLYLDNICPFFGFIYDNKVGLKVDSAGNNTDFRRIRPVWYDTWTAQIGIIVRISELPTLNVPISRVALESGADFGLPLTANLDPPTKTYNNLGVMNSYDPVEYFILTESEIRAAIAGFDNYLIYSLAKTYKPDLIEIVRRAYYIKTRNELVSAGMTLLNAAEKAFEETDWYWKLLGSNIAGDELYPTAVYPDKNDGSQYIQEKALQDLKLIHKFITEIAKYYGKKYMVVADNLRSYKEPSSISTSFQTNIGYGYIFSGGGNLKYNYEPTNDGAWEEYGNIIDDSMVVGGTEWMVLTDEVGKIKPILGYNNSYNYDYIRQAKCLASTKTTPLQDIIKEQANPYFSYDSWLTLNEYKTKSCTESYVFPALDLSSLSNVDYVIVDQKTGGGGGSPTVTALTGGLLSLSTVVKSYDAWGTEIKNNSVSLPRSKLYVPATVEENFVFLDPVNLYGPRILIDSPGINLNLSSEENARDPNRTVISNIAAEDLMLYLKTHTNSIDVNWVRYMLNYISPLVLDDQDNPYFLGLYTVSSNHTANNIELSPKAAHPLFAGIPIKSNQFVYGPWTNYPIIEGYDIVPNSVITTQTETFPKECVDTTKAPTPPQINQALNNLISNVNIEFDDDFVPWNYGGVHQLDIVAFKNIETKINYQNVIETAQLTMPGLPLFDIGGSFALENLGLKYQGSVKDYVYNDIKDSATSVVNLSYIPGATPVVGVPTQSISVATYKVFDLKNNLAFVDGPIITSIQTSVGEQGISTTYSFRTYTRKLGLFNKEETDRIKKNNQANLKRGKQIAQIRQEVTNLRNEERENFLQERLNRAQFGSSDLSSKLFSWSPSTVLVGQASPLIYEPSRTPELIEDFSLASNPGTFNSEPSAATNWAVDNNGIIDDQNSSLTDDTSTSILKNSSRITSTVQLFERKELENQLQKNYGMQSAMSLDGLLSPISFYPTFKNSTFSYSLHNTANCPFCRGTKVRTIKVSRYASSGRRSENPINIVCDKCCGKPNDKLNAKLVSDDEIPINLITLNPIVVPNGEFKNSNSQNYSSTHPDGEHGALTFGGKPRLFRDRLRHSIEIVARGSVPQSRAGYKLETSRNVQKPGSDNADYDNYDNTLYSTRSKLDPSLNLLHETNQRFFGLRGPLTLHSWGYDDEGYPVPNAADEPLEYDSFGRPKRFKLKIEYGTATKTFDSLAVGDLFQVRGQGVQVSGGAAQVSGSIYSKTFNGENLPSLPQGNKTLVTVVTLKDDNGVDGGFDPGKPSDYKDGFKGSIIGKTRKFNGKWSEKTKLKDFYLNWSERPDLWPVGPIDLFWDSKRMVWSGGKGGGAEEIDPPYIITNSNDILTLDEFITKKTDKKYIYRMIYAVLEEDLIKQPDFNETYVTRGFFDDVEYSSEPLLQGYRRLIYIKDKTGYCAPKGTKLLCRYNRLTGFYEPVSKPVITTTGKIISSSQVLLNLLYTPSRRGNIAPTSTVNYINPLSFTTPMNEIGIFSFIDSQWTLTSIKQ